MNAETLRAKQAPIKAKYRDDPASSLFTLKAEGSLDGEGLTCKVSTARGLAEAGLHPATGGDGLSLCSGDMLLEALVACAGVTLRAVATALDIPVRGGTVHAEGDLDFRGTLGVSKEVPVGFREIRLRFDLDTDASEEQRATLLKLTERYCVIYQTMKNPPTMSSRINPGHLRLVDSGMAFGPADGEGDGKRGAPARLGREVDPAPVFLDDVVGDPESQAGADPLRLGGEEGVEDLSSDRLGDSRPVVGDFDLDLAHPGHRPGPYGDGRAGPDGLDGVDQQVQQDLMDLAGAAPDAGQWLELEGELDLLLADLVSDHLDGPADRLVGVGLLELGLVEPGEVAEPVDDLADSLQALTRAPEEPVEVRQRVGPMSTSSSASRIAGGIDAPR